ncbi:proline iminopeptidase-family hydrolase [Pontiella sulfatireligans]|uniref:Proline iminopeptidase n=1 Tax=Pontiella sulfatireligans TaxID=2750658 RepID=A0A6C2UKS1_9BACT|nr:proline iminopeptidase-family hydrolase [Pontiella sulfatireligans]VGO19904.1 Proline iminopeptidase [Pontiella sulfatireligans]
MEAEEGKVRLRSGHRVWYRRVGAGGDTPLLVLHGGPGAGHDYLEPLEKLAADRPVILYDQLGCGKSDQPNDRSLWRMERFVSELDEVRKALGLQEIHLFGQSSGGMLAIDYMLTHPQGVASLILADSCAGMLQLEQEIKRLKSGLPPETIAILDRCEAIGDFQNPEYRVAVAAFYKRHVCRLSEFPDCLLRTTANLKDNPVYETMNGPNELVITGNLKDWDRTSRLSEITIPTLVLVGRCDEVTPACSETLHRGIAGSQLVVFEESSHIPHIEEEGKYLGVVSGFLSRVDMSS